MNKTFIVPLIAVLMTTASGSPVKAAAKEQEASASPTGFSIQFTTDAMDTVSAASLQLAQVTVGEALVKDAAPVVAQPKTLQEVAQEIVDQKFGPGYFDAFSKLVYKESSWNPNAVNARSGACGLGQALPCSKMASKAPVDQIIWMADYIAQRYGNPAKAWSFHLAHNFY